MICAIDGHSTNQLKKRATKSQFLQRAVTAASVMELINRVQRAFTGGSSPSTPRSSRKKNVEGWLTKRNPAGFGSKRRWFTVNGLVLYYFESETSASYKVDI
jgi:hypothetical protein